MVSQTGGQILGGIIALSIGLYFFANFFIPALQTLAGANTTGLDASQAALVLLVGVVAILSAVVMFIKAAGFKIT